MPPPARLEPDSRDSKSDALTTPLNRRGHYTSTTDTTRHTLPPKNRQNFSSNPSCHTASTAALLPCIQKVQSPDFPAVLLRETLCPCPVSWLARRSGRAAFTLACREGKPKVSNFVFQFILLPRTTGGGVCPEFSSALWRCYQNCECF